MLALGLCCQAGRQARKSTPSGLRIKSSSLVCGQINHMNSVFAAHPEGGGANKGVFVFTGAAVPIISIMPQLPSSATQTLPEGQDRRFRLLAPKTSHATAAERMLREDLVREISARRQRGASSESIAGRYNGGC